MLAWSTYLGGTGTDNPQAIAVDKSGAVYVAGFTTSTNFPLRNQYQGDQPNWDGFVTKLLEPKDGGNVTLEWSTYIGGGNEDRLYNLALDADGGVVVMGTSFSNNFPSVKQYQVYQGDWDVVVTKLRQPEGGGTVKVDWSTYLGGKQREDAQALAVDSSGAVYVGGTTTSSDFPVKNSLATFRSEEAFVTKLLPPGDGNLTLGWSTIISGRSTDVARALALDACGNVYVAGRTFSSDFPVKNALQGTIAGGQDAFVMKLSQEGAPAIAWSTFLGGRNGDQSAAISSESTPEAFLTKLAQPEDGKPDVSIEWSTFWGGARRDLPFALAVDEKGRVYAGGVTESTDLKLQNAYQEARESVNGWLMSLADPVVEVTIDSEPGSLPFTVSTRACVSVSGQASAKYTWLVGKPYTITFGATQTIEEAPWVFDMWDDTGATEAARVGAGSAMMVRSQP